jgi:serine/threonine protein kinase
MVDIWAFGCVLYELISRRKAFESDFQVYRFASATTARDLGIKVEWLTGAVKDRCDQLIRDTIHLDVQARPSAKIIHDRLSMLVAEVFPGRIELEREEISSEIETEPSLQLRDDISILNATIREVILGSTTFVRPIEPSTNSFRILY